MFGLQPLGSPLRLFVSSLLVFGLQTLFVRALHLFFVGIDVQSLLPWTFYGFLVGCLISYHGRQAAIEKVGGGIAFGCLCLLAYGLTCFWMISSAIAIIAVVAANAAFAYAIVDFSEELDAHSFYAYDFLGGIAGCLLGFVLPHFLSLEATFALLVAVGLIATTSHGGLTKAARFVRPLGLVVGVLSLLLCLNQSWDLTRFGALYKRPNDLELNPTRHGQLTWRKGETRRVYSQWSSVGKVEVYEPTNPGLQGNFGFYVNNTKVFGLRPVPSAAEVTPGPRTALILGSGGGLEARFLWKNGFGDITAVEINEVTYEITKGPFSAAAGDIFKHIKYIQAEGRNFIEARGKEYDFISINYLGSTAGLVGTSDDLSENYLFTKEALRSYYDHLSSGGILAVGLVYSEDLAPNPQLLRLVETASAVLRERGESPQKQIWILGEKRRAGSSPQRKYRGLVLMRRGEPTIGEVQFVNGLRTGFEFPNSYAVHTPEGLTSGLERAENSLTPQENLARLAPQLSQAENVKNEFGLNVFPVTDNQPYFFQYDAHPPFPLKPFTVLFWLTCATTIFFAWRIRQRHGQQIGQQGWNILLMACLLGFSYGVLEILLLNSFTLAFSSVTWVFLLLVFGLLLGAACAGLFGRSFSLGGIRVSIGVSAVILLIAAGVLERKDLFFFSRVEWLHSISIVAMTFVASFGISLAYPYLLRVGKRTHSVMPAAIFGLNSAFFILGSVVCRSLALHWGIQHTFIFLAVFYGVLAVLFPVVIGSASKGDR